MKLFWSALALAAAALTTVGTASAPASGPSIPTALDVLLASAPPTVVKAAAPLDAKRGTTLTALPVATVSDDVTPAGSLAVAEILHNTSLGPVTNVTNTGGSVTADVAVNCAGSNGNKGVIISATDGDNQTADDQADPQLIHVIPDTNPDLTYPPTPSVPAGQTSTINPATGPADNGSITTIAVQAGPAFPTSVNGTTGIVSVSPGSGDAGSYPITIRATDNCGRFTDAQFTLTVNPPTAVALRSLSGRMVRGGVQLRWRTAQESGLLGFNVYRLRNGKLVQANRRLIAAVAGGTATGHAYSWLDRTGARSGTYRLQAARLDGTLKWLGSTLVAG